jgi:hypothetical protein
LICIGVIVLAGTFSMMVRGPEHALVLFLLAAAVSLRLQNA